MNFKNCCPILDIIISLLVAVKSGTGEVFGLQNLLEKILRPEHLWWQKKEVQPKGWTSNKKGEKIGSDETDAKSSITDYSVQLISLEVVER